MLRRSGRPLLRVRRLGHSAAAPPPPLPWHFRRGLVHYRGWPLVFAGLQGSPLRFLSVNPRLDREEAPAEGSDGGGGASSTSPSSSPSSAASSSSSNTSGAAAGNGVAQRRSANLSASQRQMLGLEPTNYAAQAQKLVLRTPILVAERLSGAAGFMVEAIRDPRMLMDKSKEVYVHGKEMLNHYWVGTKLLVKEIRITSDIFVRMLSGSRLTRREHRQLVRTSADLFRLVPFAFFVLVPFMEFLLPVALRLFPNMLPSTFEETWKKEESMKKNLKMRLAMAGFMKDMLRELTTDIKARKDDEGRSASELSHFMDKLKMGQVETQDILKFARYFRDDLTLETMSRTQLVTMCRFMNLQPYGADAFLRYQLRSHIRELKNDDQRIVFESIDSLSRAELQEACAERGMRAIGLPKEAYKRQLQQWLDLSCNRHVPVALLILSRSYALTTDLEKEPEKAIADSISCLAEEVVTEVKLDVATPEERKSKQIKELKIESFDRQAEMIQEEALERERDEKLVESKSSDKAPSAADQPASTTQASEPSEAGDGPEPGQVPREAAAMEAETATQGDLDQTKGATSGDAASSGAEGDPEDVDPSISVDEIEALADLACTSAMESHRHDVERLKQAIEQTLSEENDELDTMTEKLASEIEVGEERSLLDECQRIEGPDVQVSPNRVVESVQNEMARLRDAIDQQASVDTAQADMAHQAEQHSPEVATDKARETIAQQDADPAAQPVPEKPTTEPTLPEREGAAVAQFKDRLVGMLSKLEADIQRADEAIGEKLHVLDLNEDGLLSADELEQVLSTMMRTKLTPEEASVKVKYMMKELDDDFDGQITIEQLRSWIKVKKRKKEVEIHEAAMADKTTENKKNEGK